MGAPVKQINLKDAQDKALFAKDLKEASAAIDTLATAGAWRMVAEVGSKTDVFAIGKCAVDKLVEAGQVDWLGSIMIDTRIPELRDYCEGKLKAAGKL